MNSFTTENDNNIEQTNIGPWTDIYTIAEFVHRLEKHVEAMD